ncbi:hypothetical protein CDAR_247321 [Caerostris darwini]|uniref:Uncharacterized protein n=1 Tax=Caerostris darwini TaxID=1538125 RepID=A0AAV4T9T2_9ARAC|nr:hypothetical protein CDAR_247321 [Caerostris darwini]
MESASKLEESRLALLKGFRDNRLPATLLIAASSNLQSMNNMMPDCQNRDGNEFSVESTILIFAEYSKDICAEDLSTADVY